MPPRRRTRRNLNGSDEVAAQPGGQGSPAKVLPGSARNMEAVMPEAEGGGSRDVQPDDMNPNVDTGVVQRDSRKGSARIKGSLRKRQVAIGWDAQETCTAC